jgi:hypothetical protein
MSQLAQEEGKADRLSIEFGSSLDASNSSTKQQEPRDLANALDTLIPPITPRETSTGHFDDGRIGREPLRLPNIGDRHASKSPAPPPTVEGWIRIFWTRNKGLMLVLLAQVFGTLMNVTTRLLEVEGNNGKGLHPFQVCFSDFSGQIIHNSDKDSLRSDGYYCTTRFWLYVVEKHSTLPFRCARGKTFVGSPRTDWLFWSLWHVL